MKHFLIIILALLSNINSYSQLNFFVNFSRKMNINNQTSVSYNSNTQFSNINNGSDSKYLPSFSNDYLIGANFLFKKINLQCELSLGYFSIKHKARPSYTFSGGYVNSVAFTNSFGQLGINLLYPVKVKRPTKISIGVLGTIDRFFSKKTPNTLGLIVDKQQLDSAFVNITTNHYAFDSPYIILTYGLRTELLKRRFGSLELGLDFKQGFKSLQTVVFDFYSYDKQTSSTSKIDHVITQTNGQSISLELIYIFGKMRK